MFTIIKCAIDVECAMDKHDLMFRKIINAKKNQMTA